MSRFFMLHGAVILMVTITELASQLKKPELELLHIIHHNDPPLFYKMIAEIQLNSQNVEALKALITDFPHRQWFQITSHKKFGDIFEADVVKSFRDLGPRRDSSHDSTFYHDRVEIKVMRMTTDKQGQKRSLSPMVERARKYDPTISGGVGGHSFQQVKPTAFDLLLCVTIYTNAMSFYIIPSDDICPTPGADPAKTGHKLKLNKQHRGHGSEGLLTVSAVLPYHVKTIINTPLSEMALSFNELLKENDRTKKYARE